MPALEAKGLSGTLIVALADGSRIVFEATDTKVTEIVIKSGASLGFSGAAGGQKSVSTSSLKAPTISSSGMVPSPRRQRSCSATGGWRASPSCTIATREATSGIRAITSGSWPRW